MHLFLTCLAAHTIGLPTGMLGEDLLKVGEAFNPIAQTKGQSTVYASRNGMVKAEVSVCRACAAKRCHSGSRSQKMPQPRPVSYTHLTLPTICSV